MSVYVPHHTPSMVQAMKLTATAKSPLNKYNLITSYVTKNFVYDYVRAATIPKRNGLPNVDRCWRNHMGICLDIAAMTTGMLRAVGLKATLCIGHADQQYHAWVETNIDGRIYRYDHDGKADSYHTERRY